jgi:hypothetical protein
LGLYGAKVVCRAFPAGAAAAIRAALLAVALQKTTRTVHADIPGPATAVGRARQAVLRQLLVAHPVSAPGLEDALALLADVLLVAIATTHPATVVAAFLAHAVRTAENAPAVDTDLPLLA